jgi:dynein light chain 1
MSDTRLGQMSTCNLALKAWEAANEGKKAEDAEKIQLFCQIPPITKLDNSLNTLKNCEWLSLSTNSIDRLIPLVGMKKLRILAIGRNQLKKIEKLEVKLSSHGIAVKTVVDFYFCFVTDVSIC